MFGKLLRFVLRNRMSVLLLMLSVVMVSASIAPDTSGTPFTWGLDDNGNPITGLRWGQGDTINVFIEPDPDPTPPDRSQLLRDGIMRWQGEMAARGITVNATVGDPPNPPPSGTVRCTYEPSGTQRGGHTLGSGPGQDDAIATADGNTEDGITGGEIIVRDDIPAGTPGQQDHIRNIGEHELTHILGLGDDANGVVTNHTQGDTPNVFNDTDRREIGQLYPLPQQNVPQGQGNTQSSMNPNQYDWDFHYVGPSDGHVALITMSVPPELIVYVIPPSGWLVLNPADTEHRSLDYPFYENYMECGSPGQAPWDPSYTAPLAFRPQSEEEALSATNPSVHVTLFTNGAIRGEMSAWAGGPAQTLTGPVLDASQIPTVSEWGVAAIALLLIGTGIVLIRRRLRGHCSE
ncbi:MAG: IPTL-CTERM sorting domain-containing protein [Chitinivibrionia bacterium]|nr:IPTL-CTERM sorting domain-containing protein [Chitinivibrionia bacterium]